MNKQTKKLLEFKDVIPKNINMDWNIKFKKSPWNKRLVKIKKQRMEPENKPSHLITWISKGRTELSRG